MKEIEQLLAHYGLAFHSEGNDDAAASEQPER
jgi:hypothetical protein